MDWADLTELYSDEFISLKPFPREIAELEFNYLTQSVTARFPEALEDPLLLIKTDIETTRNKLIGDKPETNIILRRSGQTYTKIYEFLKRYKDTGDLHPALYAPKHNFTKQQAVFCCAEWLSNNGWQDINTGIVHLADYDLTATKNDVHLFAYGVSSANSAIEKGEKMDVAKANFKKEIAFIVFKLLDEMAKNPKLHPALILPDDHRTRDLMLNYTPITRLGITLFWVTGINEVKEI